jgi:glycosyltransferase involved in cell wall biosynthesis
MNLLHVIAGSDPGSGGPIEALLRISEVLIRDGHHIEVLSLEPKAEAEKRSFPFPVVGIGHGTRPYRYNAQLTPWLNQNAGRFDAIVLHGLWNYSSLGSWRALRSSPTPYYIFTHGMMDPWFRDQYPLKHMAKQIFWSVAEGRVLRDARAVLFTCEEERLRSRNVFKGHRYDERVARLGTADPGGDPEIQKAKFISSFLQLKHRRFLLFLSRIHPKKGCDLLIRAFAHFAPKLPSDLDLVIAGPDQVGWKAELQSLAQTLGIAERIHWPGMLRDDVKWGAFRQAEALILPSHQENFGFVVAEAMACSTPVLISDKVNVWREVQSSQSGMVQPDTIGGIQRLVHDFLALSQSQRLQMRNAARAGFLKSFDVEVTARDFASAIGFNKHKETTSAAAKQT